MTEYLFDGDLDAILENVPAPAKARVLVDHYDSLAERFVAEFEKGLMSADEARAAVLPT